MKRYKGHTIKKTAKGYDVYFRGARVAHGPDLAGAKFWVDSYGKKPNPARTLKAQRATAAKKAATERRVASALAKYLRAQNPAMKTAGAKVQRLKGGVIKITPIKKGKR